MNSQASSHVTPAPGPNHFTELGVTVEELVRLTREYNQFAATIQNRKAFLQNEDELRRREVEIEPLVHQVVIGQSKMGPTEKAEFDRQHYDTKAKPVIEVKSMHRKRFESYFQ